MRERINEIILGIATCGKEIEKIEISETTNLKEDLGMDSLDLAELTVCLEEEFGIDVFEDGLVETAGEIYEKINSN